MERLAPAFVFYSPRAAGLVALSRRARTLPMTPVPLFALSPSLSIPIAVGVVVGLVVVGFFAFRRRERTFPTLPPVQAKDWETSDSSFADRRSALRREGRPVKILVTSPSFKNEVEGGYVLDRSTGGMRIALTMAMTPGSTMQVRAHNAPKSTPWVTIIVRNCRNAGQHYELGVEFDQTPPWNVLLLFG